MSESADLYIYVDIMEWWQFYLLIRLKIPRVFWFACIFSDVNCCTDKNNNHRSPKKSWNKPIHCWTYHMVVLSFVIRPLSFIMVARSSIARSRLPLYFTAVSFFLAILSQTSENRHPRNFPTWRGLVFNRTFAIAISSKCPLKRTGLKNPKFVPFFMPSRRQLARSSITRRHIKNLKH